MRLVLVVSTNGGVGKTTVAANYGGLFADARLRVLLLDLDSQPTLFSRYTLSQKAVAGAYEFIALNLTAPAQIVSRTLIAGLDLIFSNDDQGQLNTLLLHAPGGRLRLRNLLDHFRSNYDLLLIDAQGARRVLMTIVAADLALSPITPAILAACELRRATMKLLSGLEPFRRQGISTPPLRFATEPGERHLDGRQDDHLRSARVFRWGSQHPDSRYRNSRPSAVSQCRLPWPTGSPDRDAAST
jgi:chromosome partitioning related protein ParA